MAGLGVILAFGVLAGPALERSTELLQAASTRDPKDWSPRRLFNASLREEEQGHIPEACQLLMAAGLSPRFSLADELYARGATLRLVRFLAERDQDAALAVALGPSTHPRSASDLPHLAGLPEVQERRSRIDRVEGTIVGVWLAPPRQGVWMELSLDGGERRKVEVAGRVAPFSAGSRVQALLLPGTGRGSWRLLALAEEGAAAWMLLRVEGIANGVDQPDAGRPPGGARAP